MKNRILVVEDDAAIRDAVLLNLQFADYDAVAFDPGMDGFELFGIMERFGIPVIYMTAKTDSACSDTGATAEAVRL